MVDPKGLSAADGYGNGTGVDFIKALFPKAGESGPINQCEAGKCERTVTVRKIFLCDDNGDCPKERFGPPITLDVDCLLRFGVVTKAGGAVVGNLIVGKAVPAGASALGFGARAMAVVNFGVGVFTGPYGIAFGGAMGIGMIADKCTCNK